MGSAHAAGAKQQQVLGPIDPAGVISQLLDLAAIEIGNGTPVLVRQGFGPGSVRRHQAEHPHQVWALDFKFNATDDGRRLKFLNVIDEHRRLCLVIRVGRRCKAKDVVAVLEELTSLYPEPAFISSDNGPEFIAHALRTWCKNSGTATAYIERGSPWQNGFA